MSGGGSLPLRVARDLYVSLARHVRGFSFSREGRVVTADSTVVDPTVDPLGGVFPEDSVTMRDHLPDPSQVALDLGLGEDGEVTA